MNKANLKSYAPKARLDFIKAVTARANVLGISAEGAVPAEVRGAVAVIDGREWPAKVSGQRDKLIERIRKDGLAQTLEAIAYTWFNRFAALRYMELHDYLGHGHRALSSTSGGLPDILTHATDLTNELPGLNAAKVTELKLAGNRDGELYRMLLVAQCNALSRAMPFLFERIDDDSELLLPDNLLRSDSVIAKLVEAIPEGDWAEVEVIGWLYQFYISEKKDQVIGKVVKSEDIPAATQLFTPNWIVQYLVQNSVGRLWLMGNPQSTLAKEWLYYITPAEQTSEVQAQLDALIQTRVREDGDTLNPESITVLDPACGSGHILVVAYDVLKAIYLERGYQPRVIPRLILEKNLYGLDIDDRAAQLAGFALLMKARADDRRLFTATDDAGNLQPPKLNVLSLQESKGLSIDELGTHLAPFKVQRATIAALVEAFEHAKTFGSLIQIPYALKTHLAVLPEMLAEARQSGEMYSSAAAEDLLPLVQQAQMLAMQFDAVVANPPYMGTKGMNTFLKNYANSVFPNSKSDLFSMFIERGFDWCKRNGFNSMVTMQSWMFLSSYEDMRVGLLANRAFVAMAHLGARAFGEITGEVVQTTAFVFLSRSLSAYKPTFLRLTEGQENEKRVALLSNSEPFNKNAQNSFNAIPGSPIAYWISESMRSAFVYNKIGDLTTTRKGMVTANNDLFVRLWQEISLSTAALLSDESCVSRLMQQKWFPYIMGGEYKKWYGNRSAVVNWKNNGNEIRTKMHPTEGRVWATNFNLDYIFRKNVNWNSIAGAKLSFRYSPGGEIFASTGLACFSDKENEFEVLGFLNSKICESLLKIVAPTLSANPGDIGRLPVATASKEVWRVVAENVKTAISISKIDWDSFEISWDFLEAPVVSPRFRGNSLSDSWAAWHQNCSKKIDEIKCIEESNNKLLIEAYDLQDELTPEVPESHITLARADREKDSQRLISYAVGCMMGRYSLDEPGLIYAHAGNVGFDASRYATFPADSDGIVPLTQQRWFADDAASRVREFLLAVWSADTLNENMDWLAASLGQRASETPDETIRRYLADKFFKDHLQTYKKRPIYWLFSSGKQSAFQALVYLHRYTEGTLARLRAEYVVPQISKVTSHLDMLSRDVAAASSAAARTKLQKQIEALRKEQFELLAYDEKLRHYADMRITLDLDDGVKVNYGKFGDLLEGVKLVTGGAGDD